MSIIAHPLVWLIGITVFLWGAAIWATIGEERPERPARQERDARDLAA